MTFVKRWVVIGICLNNVLTPALRKYVTPIVTQMYKSLVKQYHIDNQKLHGYLRKYPPTNTMLNYEPINDNENLYGRHTWKYDYDVKNPIDLSKLFLQTHMAHYVAFDDTCDSSALLAIIINIDQFPLAVQEDADEVRTSIRNCWAHCNVLQWTPARFVASFQLLESFIRNLHLNATEEIRVLGDLHNWKTNGTKFINISVLGAELVGMIQNANATRIMAECTQHEFKETTLKCLQLQKELIKIEKKIDELKTNNGKYLLESNAKVSECSSTDPTEPKNVTAYAPCPCHDTHQLDVSLWQEHDSTFFETDIVNDIIKYLETEHFVIVVGASGMVKSAIIHHIALQICHEGGRSIIPCHSPQEVINHYKKNEFPIFVIDDICGKYAESEVDIDNWINNRNKLKMMLGKGKIKILTSCCLEIFNEEKVQRSLTPFISYSFDLSSKYKLSPKAKLVIAGKYLMSNDCENLQDVLGSFACSPLLCFLFSKYENITRHEFVNEPYNIFRSELDELKVVDPHKYCLLFMFVIFNGTINESLFYESNEDERKKLENVFKSLKIERSTALSSIKDKLDFCVGTYVIKIGANLNKADKCGDTPLYVACFEGYENVVRLLINEGAEINKSTKLGVTPLFAACTGGDTSIVNILVEQGAGVNYITKFGNTPLVAAGCGGFESIVKTLVNKGASVNKTFENEESPLLVACKRGHENIVRLLIEHGAAINYATKSGNTSLNVACCGGYESIVQLLINKKASINKTNENNGSPLYVSCLRGYKNIVQLLLEKGAKANYSENNYVPLHAACLRGDYKIAKLLIKKQSEVNTPKGDGQTPLHAAVKSYNEKLVDLLVCEGADINKTYGCGFTPLYEAPIACNLQAVQILIEKGALIYVASHSGETALFVACREGNYEISKLLVEKWADLNKSNCYCNTPLHIASAGRNEKIVKILVKNNADINKSNNYKETPFYTACEKRILYNC
ncbi:unnamed protein product [Mytilus coruscus]|uniref:Novel STAND NTPase 3 domain-containing protein n=1 Tax=Mytilus coruscus TaxID=42192 RepID=A0A6J8BAU1_MYTCO|nr:unnamed protein product [Mytilus coruscus]